MMTGRKESRGSKTCKEPNSNKWKEKVKSFRLNRIMRMKRKS